MRSGSRGVRILKSEVTGSGTPSSGGGLSSVLSLERRRHRRLATPFVLLVPTLLHIATVLALSVASMCLPRPTLPESAETRVPRICLKGDPILGVKIVQEEKE